MPLSYQPQNDDEAVSTVEVRPELLHRHLRRFNGAAASDPQHPLFNKLVGHNMLKA